MDKKKTKTISVIVPEEMKIRMEQIAKQEDRNLSWIVRKAIQEYLDKKGN